MEKIENREYQTDKISQDFKTNNYKYSTAPYHIAAQPLSN